MAFIYDVTLGNEDYEPGPYYATFKAGTKTTELSVKIINNNAVENSEQFSLRIAQEELPNKASVAINGSGITTVTIVDDNSELTTVTLHSCIPLPLTHLLQPEVYTVHNFSQALQRHSCSTCSTCRITSFNQCDQMNQYLNFFKTICELAGIFPKAHVCITGVNFCLYVFFSEEPSLM